MNAKAIVRDLLENETGSPKWRKRLRSQQQRQSNQRGRLERIGKQLNCPPSECGKAVGRLTADIQAKQDELSKLTNY